MKLGMGKFQVKMHKLSKGSISQKYLEEVFKAKEVMIPHKDLLHLDFQSTLSDRINCLSIQLYFSEIQLKGIQH